MYLSANKHFIIMTLDFRITDNAGFNDNKAWFLMLTAGQGSVDTRWRWSRASKEKQLDWEKFLNRSFKR